MVTKETCGSLENVPPNRNSSCDSQWIIRMENTINKMVKINMVTYKKVVALGLRAETALPESVETADDLLRFHMKSIDELSEFDQFIKTNNNAEHQLVSNLCFSLYLFSGTLGRVHVKNKTQIFKKYRNKNFLKN